MDRNNIRMLQLSRDLGFLHETQNGIFRTRLRLQPFDRDEAAQIAVPRAHNFAHTAGAELLQVLVFFRRSFSLDGCRPGAQTCDYRASRAGSGQDSRLRGWATPPGCMRMPG